MSTKYIASNWRLPNQENSSKSDNYGLTFDGSSERIEIPFTKLNGLTNCSISFWAKINYSVDSEPKYPLTLTSGTDFDIMWIFGANGTSLDVYIGNVNFRLDGSFNNDIDEWNHWVLRFDGSQSSGNRTKIYQNGQQLTSEAGWGTATSIPTASHLIIGGRNLGSTAWFYQFPGSISDISIFDYTLTESQISTLYGSSSLGAGNPMALKPQPVAYYPLGDNSASNPLTQPNEAVEDASVFDFIPNDDINCGNPTELQITGDITVSAWFKSTYSGAGAVDILSKGYYGNGTISYVLYLRGSGGGVGFDYYGGNTLGTRVYAQYTVAQNDGQWHHLVGVKSGSSSILYLDGAQVATGTGTQAAIYNSSQDVIIGANSNNAAYFDGEISNAQIWNTGLSEPEIETLYNSGVPLTGTQPQASNLKVWYKLDQSANWEADSSGDWQIPDAVSAYPQSFDFVPSDVVTVSPLGISGSTARTISCWFNVDSTVNQNIIGFGAASQANYFALALYNSGGFKIFGHTWNTGGIGGDLLGPIVTPNEWHLAVLVYDGTDLKISLDGSTFNTTTVPLNTTNTDFTIGDAAYTGWPNFDGQISNVQVWETDLSQSEVTTLYNNGVPLTTAIASDNLKLWAKLDNTATFSTNWSIPDASGNGNTGTSSGMTEQNLVNNNVSVLNGESSGMTSANLVLSDLTRAVPYDSYSFNFDSAANDYIDCGLFSNILSDMSNTTKFTISCWYKTDGTGYKGIFGSGGFVGLSLYFNSGDVIFTADSTAKIQASCTYGDNNWHHLTCVYDGSAYDGGTAITMRLYFDGTEIGTDTDKRGSAFDSSKKFWIGGAIVGGAGTTSPNPLFNGSITQLSIFDEALTSTEVLKLYSNGVPQDLANFTPAPVAWYPLGSNSFWNGSQWTVRDMIGSNDGTGVNLGQDALVGDSPRSTAGGTGTNMDVPSNLEGSTKWSDNNSWSINMSETARVEDTP